MDGFNQPSHSASRGLPQPAARGTREFVEGIPEFCVSVGFVGNSHPVAGGIYNPATDETFLGSIKSDVPYNGKPYNGKPCQPSHPKTLDGALVLASRSEVMRGECKAFENAALRSALQAFTAGLRSHFAEV